MSAAPPLRLLSSRARALGTGDFDSLENVDTTILPNGAACWVADTQTWYVLDHAAVAGPPNVTPINGPGFWTPLTGGAGGGIPMPDGTVILPQGANFINELGLGLFRPAAGLMGLAQGGFLGLQMGSGIETNVDPLSPSIVRYVMRGFNRPLTGGENETSFLYVRVDPSVPAPQQAALYVDITGNQLDTMGPAIKIVHAGHGDGVYVAQFANGSAYEAASFADGSRGYISTIQLAGQPNSTLFNALWDQADVPNFGMFYADLSTANALTIRKRAATAVDGLTQIRVIEETGLQRFGIYNDGSAALSALLATAGVPTQASPELHWVSTAWDGVGLVSRDNEWIAKAVPSTPNVGTWALYHTTPLGTSLVMQLDNNNAAPEGHLRILNGVVHARQLQSDIELKLLFNAGTLGLDIGNVTGDYDTAMQSVLCQDPGPVYTDKAVTQGYPDSAGSGYQALRVQNTGSGAVVAGDFALANWGGAGEGVVVAAGSNSRRGRITVTAGAAPAPAWTITLTFPIAFGTTPFAICARNDTNNPPMPTNMSVTGLASTTQLVFSELGGSAPLAGVTYDFTWILLD